MSVCGIAKHLLRNRLAACVNVIPRIRSFYYWEGKINDEGETLLVCKTAADRADDFVDTVRDVHNAHAVPEIVGLEASVVERRYQKWVFDETRPSAGDD